MDNAALRISDCQKDHLICEVLLHDERMEGYFFDNLDLGETNLVHLADQAIEIIEEDISNHSFSSEGFCFDPEHSYQTTDGAVLFFRRFSTD